MYPQGYALTGSSPLARGLRQGIAHENTAVRIIPARAGFTRKWPSAARRPPDHPRSRGVYGEIRVPVIEGAGSSPLARGLLKSGIQTVWDSGIIPARAGFTWICA